MKYKVITIQEFAQMNYDVLKSDRDAVIGVGGMTGEGKSTFSTLVCKEYGQLSGNAWNFNLMTWDRQEMMTWIDGDKTKDPDPITKLRPGQLPEYSAINPDELFSMFYRRNWYKDDQVDAIQTFNMCRDRHLMVIGNIPSFWDLDGGFTNRIRFYVFIVKRGVAWVFEQEKNPFSKDPWCRSENQKIIRKKGYPYSCANFLFEIHYPDWDEDEKAEYYKIRNDKRINAVTDNKPKIERFADIKHQRDCAIRELLKCDGYNQPIVSQIVGMAQSSISDIKEGRR